MEDTALSLLENAPVWLVCGYIIYKDVKNLIRKNIEKDKKSADSLREQAIHDTLKEVRKYLEILSGKQKKEITKDQAETIIELITKEKEAKIVEHAAIIIRENNLAANEESVKDRLKIFFSTLKDSICNQLNRFSYKELSLLEVFDFEGLKQVELSTMKILFNREFSSDNTHRNLIKELDTQFSNIKVKSINKL